VGVPEEHLVTIRDAMSAVVNGGGTGGAARLNIPGVMMAGKTGTAQVRNYDKGGPRGKGGPWHLRDHGLFVAFAPTDAPRYAVAVIVQHGMGGSTAAAPRAREIMRTTLLKDPDLRARIEKPLPMPEMIPDMELDTVPDAATIERTA
jgi:penicillin-binding protein 2